MKEIKDLIILGESWPELMRDGRFSICVAAYSKELGFIRLYPARTDSPLRAWNIVDVKVERNPTDTRLESWKFANSKNWESINKNIKLVGKLDKEEQIKLAKTLGVDSTEKLLAQRRSLGIIKPEIISWSLTDTGIKPSYQMTLTGKKLRSKKDFGVKPYIEYRCLPHCSSKKPHKQQLLEWGVYMWLNKNKSRADKEKVFENLRISDNSYEKYFVVGNLAFKRKTFAIINVIRFKK